MESKISMETKKDIYSSWVQYTTKNEEAYFRHFVRGFVSIWEAQLQLDWNRLETLPNWTNVKPDTGPHLTRLPEELLPAIGKFIYIANDNTEKGLLKSEGLIEVDLLVRCLIAISRNLDNIPLIASCDYIGLCVSIASSIIQQIVSGTCQFEAEAKAYCLSLCHLLECLYDPYFTWRYFSPSTKIPLERLTFQPALLHVEVIPFIYDCFQTELVTKYPDLSSELLNVLGAIVSGAEHNALRSVCPATASLVMEVIVNDSIDLAVRAVALQAFVVMIGVLHSTPPPQRQIEISTVIELYKESFDKILKNELKTEIGNDELELIIHLVRTVRSLLTMSSHKVDSLQVTLINSNLLDTLLNTVSSSSCVACDGEKSNFLTECVKAVASMISGASSGKERMLKSNGYEKLFSALKLYGKPDRVVLEALIAMTTESEDSSQLMLNNPETLIQLIGWLSHLSEENQIWVTNRLLKICTLNSNSLNLSCETGVIKAVCNVLASQTVTNFNSKALAELVQLLEALASHSLSAFELKQLFLLLREDNDIKNLYRNALLNALSSISRKGAQQIDCHDYFEIQTENDGITISDMKKWSGASYGFSFHCWIRLDKEQMSENSQASSHRRQLFNFVTAGGTGIEAFFCSDGALIVGVNTKKELLATTVPECSMLDGLWHCLVICHTSARRPFGHNQLSVYIDGAQRLAASIKFPAFTEPFSVCTIGAVPARSSSNANSPTDKAGAASSLVEKGILPSFITQVPNYFSLPLRSSAPIDPHVKNFPPGMQDTLFGPPTCLKGCIGLISLFHEPLTLHQVKTLHEGGPNNRDLFILEDSADHLVLSSKLVWCFSPAASHRGQCSDLAAPGKFSATALARHCHTKVLKDVINGVGGIHVLYPILESVGNAGDETSELDLSVFSPTPVSSPLHPQDMDGWELLPSSSTSDTRLQQNPVSSFLLLLRNVLIGNTLNQEQLLKHNGVAVLGDLLSKVPAAVMDIPVLVAVQRLIELAKGLLAPPKSSLGHKAALTQPLLLRSFYQHILFNFGIWSKCPFHVKVGHIQYISTVIKDERKVFRKRYGIQFFLDTIRRNFSTVPENDESKAIRISLLGLIKYFLQKECNHKEVSAIIGFLITVKEEILVCEVLDMLIALLESKSCREQLFILMFEPQAAEVLYCLLIEKNFSMELKQRVLKLISVLLRTEKIYDRNKSRLRLSDHSPIGLYPGLIAMLPDNQFSMEFTVILLEQILLSESSSSYASALSLIHALALCSVDVKLEAARKILTVTFMRPTAPQLFAKQLGWQDCITRLLVKCPISVRKSDSLPDLMSFEETEDGSDTALGGGRCSPSSVSRLSISDAASTLELEIKEVAETVGHAVADNIHYAADNISSAVASVYTSFKQKTFEMQESLEEFGETARSRLKKRRSLTSLQEPESPLPVRTSHLLASLGLDMDTISFTNSDRRSQSSSDEGDGDNVPASPHLSLESSNSVTSQSSLSLNSQGAIDVDEATEDEILFDALQKLKALDAEKVFDREQDLCHLVVNILFTIMWRGIDGSQKDAWKERGQVMACINLLGLNNTLHCSHLKLKLLILEMAVTAALSDLRDATQTSENAAQLLRWVYDLTVLDPNNDNSKKVSARLLDGVLGLLDSLLVFQEVPGEEWTEMAKLAFGIILSCAANSNLELCAMSTAKLHTLVQTRTMKDLQEGGYLLYFINTILQKAISDENQEHYSFLIPVVKALLEKLKDMLMINQNLPDLPQPQAGPAFYEGFQTYCQGEQWTSFMDTKVKPLYEAYQSALSSELTESMNTFWAECYEASKTSTHRRNREVGESKLRFQSQIMSGYRSRQTEETVRYSNLNSQMRNRDLIVRRCWGQMRQFFTGERGSWFARKQEEKHWKLSCHETYSRMRLKLKPYPHFNPHTDASNLRDNTGWISRMRSDEVPLSSLNLASAAVRGDTEDTDHIPEEDLWNPDEAKAGAEGENDGEVGSSAGSNREKIILSQECDLVVLMSAVKGRLDISTTHVYFYDLSPVKEEVERHDFKWPLSRLREIYLRRYNLRRSALEFFLVDQTNYFLNFTTKTRNRVVSRLLSLRPPNLLYTRTCSPADLLRLSGLTQKWVNLEISNFDYLMQLNTLAGRTYNDLSQYPVFPWILADYSSSELDLTNPKTFRDLSKPIGVQNPENEQKVRTKYDCFEDPSGTVAKFHYGSHYSNSAGVLHYLVRVEPFTSLHIELQSARFDVADRQFYSIPQTWKLLMNNPNDVKELIPEFFYFPEFLQNLNNFDLGLLQGTKERVNDVILPPWASSAEDFIYKHRKALESEYVSQHLHEWIDLIFGYKQKGAEAIKALNVFYYCSYEGAVDLDAIANPVEREAVEGMINCFGQTPSQLLKEAHPPRAHHSEAITKLLRSDSKKPDITQLLDKLTPFHVPVLNEKDPIVFVSTPRSPPRGFLQSGLPDSLVTVSRSAVVGLHSWLSHDRHSNRGFTFDIDPTMANAKTKRNISGTFHPSLALHSKLFALSHDGKLLFTAGHWDSSIRVFSLTKNKFIASAIRHFDVVTCLALDQCGWYMVSGSLDSTCVVWDMSQLGSGPPRPFQVLYGHDKPVVCVAIATELDAVVSGSSDGTVNVHTIHEGQYLRTLRPPKGCDGLQVEISFITISAQGHIAFSANDKFQTSNSVHVFSINGTSLGSKYVSGRVTGLVTAGDCLVVVDDAGDLTISRLLGLYPVYDVPLHVPIQSVVGTNDSTHLLVPLRDGAIVVIGVSPHPTPS